tara:strand:+ start:301 stop:528 length:228 start_codon:yes stop_codon:yes gene_type:complete
MITANNIQHDVFSKKYKEAQEKDKMMGRIGRRKTSRSDIDFAVQIELAWDLENILNARSEKLSEVLDKLKSKYNR